MESSSAAATSLALVELALAGLPAAVRDGLPGVDRILLYSVPLVLRFRRVNERDGLLLHGDHGWAEAAPFWDYDPAESSTWLSAALAGATTPDPPILRSSVPVNVTIPVSAPEAAAARVRASGGCATAKIKVADPGVSLEDDSARVEAVAAALVETVGAERAHVRVDANAAWSPHQAIPAIRELDRAAALVDGLEYVEQPCVTVEELAEVRRAVDVPIAADESIRRAEDPIAVARAGAADVAIVKVAPLGGIERALRIGEQTGLRVVISSALESSVGLARGVLAAAALPGEPPACGLATAQLLASDVTRTPLLPVAGRIEVREVVPDESLLGAVALPEGLEARWRERLMEMCAVLLDRDHAQRRGDDDNRTGDLR